MRADIQWHSMKGTRTSDNRDRAGFCMNARGSLMIVTDGSTDGESNGVLAQTLVKELVDWFATTSPVSAETLQGFLSDLHREVAPRFPRGSASYLIVICGEEECFAAYSGDCTLGTMTADEAISWVTAPHTLANAIKDLSLAEIAKSKARHLLTSSFRSKEFIAPTIVPIEAPAERLIIATDGFWAELDPKQQTAFLNTGRRDATDDQDDCSALLLKFNNSKNANEVHLVDGTQNTIYVCGTDYPPPLPGL